MEGWGIVLPLLQQSGRRMQNSGASRTSGLTGSWPSARCFKISECISFSSGPCIFHIVTFALFPGVSESAQGPFKTKTSTLIALGVPPDVISLVSKARYFGGSFVWCSSQGLGMPDTVHRVLTLQRDAQYLLDSSRLWEVGFWAILSLSYPPPCGPFILCWGEAVQIVFNSFSRRSINLSSCSLLHPWGQISPESSFTTILNHLQNQRHHFIVDLGLQPTWN